MPATRRKREFPTSATLFLRLKPGAPTRELAWREFEKLYAPMISGFARKMGARPQDREDIVQDVLTGFFARSPEFTYDPSKGRFRGYLKTCTLRAALRRMGDNARFDGVSIAAPSDGAVGVEQVWNDIWEQQYVRRALRELREKYGRSKSGARTFRAFELTALDDCSPTQVARELAMSVESVRQARHRVTAQLRRKLRHLEATHG
ncbi:MAG: sigma-70 family RNA polymerase sigma factor [Tepidisphaeraceae bacterium]